LSDFHEPLAPPTGFSRLTPLSEALAALGAACAEIAPRLTPIGLAAGKIAAAPLCAPAALPSRPIALRAGWAVAAQETLGASSYAPGFARAAPVEVRSGDFLPEGADAVLPPSSVAKAAFSFEILSPAAPGEGVRARGDDLAEGEIIIGAGDRLRPVDVALARLAGLEEASLRIPRVRILSRAGAGDWLAALAAQEGAESCCAAIDLRAPDDLEKALARPDADLVIAFGAAEAGDPVAQWLAAKGILLAHGLAVRPGEAMGCGLSPSRSGAPGAPIIFAPERIECQLAAWLLLARPCLRRLAGAADREGPGETRLLARKIVSLPGIAEFVLLRRAADAGGAAAWEPLATGDIPFAAIARADAWLLVAPEGEGYAAGQNLFAHVL
jgi:molybdopterin biosynthesis enzyme